VSAASEAGDLARRVLRYRGARLAAAYLAIVAVAAAFVDALGLDALKQDLIRSLEGPSRDYWFGTDELGRDILARVVHGARTSLVTAAGAVAFASAIGVPAGLVAGFFGGWRDAILMRIVDFMLSLPGILFAMALIAVLGRSQTAALVAVGLTGIPAFARVTRAQVLSLKKRDFVTAVEAFGATSNYIMFRTVLPNSWSPILVQIVVLSSVAILLEAALSFLGVGIPPPQPSWGEMLRTGKEYLHESPTYALLPGLALTLTILSFDVLGRTISRAIEGGRDAGGAP
jgi:peptide/nickel transport system permease protein